ncbi:flagellar motor protein MotB [Microbacterium sp. APC 3898]|uniref:Flagellar motor protein MotB n=1 Tax=Planococcus notacanthi TaxID=3035188 RepID=A0ABT7ZL45_9BACL|nr:MULTISPECIES: flagellar motor protein MotB [Terrabacteria group]MDN3427882.1 flagellar motor protein MotB [Planococcus sp. APC 4016]MDN3439165.1 flagellar motor protein MotB [Planococcus sp. APC 3900]MDN3498583.1 flagellar motor protein MotB [Microbacterium sp. APC 3898]
MKRKKKHEEHVDEAWLLPYADILTLLLALFIVLFAASEVDSKKFQAISSSFNSELQGGTGILDQEAPVESLDPSTTAKLNEDLPSGESEEEILAAKDQQELEDFQTKIEAYIDEKGLSPRLQTEMTVKGLMITIREGVLFESGSADIIGGSQTIADEISNLLVSDPPRMIFIEGHTDNIPAGTKEYPTNWELSSARAINFMKILLENDKLDPEKFSATGYSEYHPIATNDTPEGRTENRRVEVLISPYEKETEE